jgi:hypothetical protein
MTRIEHTLAGGQLWNAFHNRQLAVFCLRSLPVAGPGLHLEGIIDQ